MANYLLLRNNKESGPYSLDDLMQLGLKAYDLVWVQGKSAAWRYPSEVDELKPIAPTVEEQPYDRFYKKPSDTHQEARPVAQQLPPEELKKQEIPIDPGHEKYLPKKSVFVTMPGQKNNSSTAPQPAAKREEYTTPVQKERTPDPIPVHQTITISENPAAAQIKYSQPLDEIKEMYVKTLQDRKQKIARKSFWLQSLKKAAVILSLVAVGLIAGFILRPNGNKKGIVSIQDQASPSISIAKESLVKDTINENIQLQELQQVQVPEPQNRYIDKEQGKTANPPAYRETFEEEPLIRSEQKSVPHVDIDDKSSGRKVEPQNSEIDPNTGERTRSVRKANNNPPADLNAVRPEEVTTKGGEFSGLVSVKSNEYKRVAFGGIRNLELTVTNDSKYTLDNVIVELNYLKPSEDPLRTQNVHFTSIGPNTTATIRIPDTNRGIKISYRIINIKSKQFDETTAGN
jgi:hypothetical protein